MTVAAAPAQPTGSPSDQGGGAQAQSAPPATTPTRSAASEACPLCSAPLHPEQEWCLNCGAAARTRLAATPNWKIPIAVLASVVALSLGVLAAAIVKLTGDSDSTTTAIVKTITTAPAATIPPATSTTTPGTSIPTTSVPSTSTPATSTPSTSTPATTSASTTTAPTSSSTTTTRTKGAFGLSPAQVERLDKIKKSRAPSTTAP